MSDNKQVQPTNEPIPFCDLETGVCSIPEVTRGDARVTAPEPTREILYIGDPMCSWCWGISPGLKELEAEAERKGIPFSILVGGLRPGGGDPWTPRFRDFLRHHWEEIGARSGQPFSLELLERESFNYDTEPAARAFVVMRAMLQEARAPESRLYEMFAEIQRKFYVDNEDPTMPDFFKSICDAYELDYEAFLARFDTPNAKQATKEEFQKVRALGVSGFPTVLYRDGDELRLLASGYSTGPRMVAALNSASAQPRVAR
ncbi:MAG: DsbA family protein [Myxococcaceae bacterium]